MTAKNRQTRHRPGVGHMPGPTGNTTPTDGNNSRTQTSVVSTKQTPLHVTASTIDIVLAALIDLATIAIFAGATYMIVNRFNTQAWVLTVIVGFVALSLIGLLCASLAIRGQGLGHRILGLRTVRRTDGYPPGWLRLTGLTTVDIRSGNDPFQISPIAPEALQTAATMHPATPLMLVAKDGTTVPLHGPTLIGRSPIGPPRGGLFLISIHDFSQTVSKTHALLEPEGNTVRVRDLGSTTGTRIYTPRSGPQLVGANQVGIASVGNLICFGEREFALTTGRIVAS